jgi:hypothetical protein
MTDFKELEINKGVDEMSEEEAKKTLSEFMESHQKNRTAYDELQTELDETETEYQEKLEEREERIHQFKQERAEAAAEYVNMPADLLVDRFSIDEIDQILAEADEADFSEEEETPEEEEGDENLTTFSEKPEKGRAESGGKKAEYRERATSVLKNKGFPVSE